ncbi:GntR family transcriptional regulator [Sinosporangium siamense]|uniref:HTH gntR-type domain-containing protein n=1 Tax=Sinosporangium siamense TaxID=1367973 RepID=A0A919V5F1_9ACTN|nr:GntR family transcriptional regulator [Sinosporangium siamense]GII92940.1 hypothetical protein Ssi02_31710 [Sinosporangium siamense]
MTSRDSTAASAAELIAEDLRERLLRLELYPGSPLREIDLSERYAASRHTVRAALALLEAEGVLVHDRHRGARVREFDAYDVNDAFDLREALEIEAVRLICRRRPSLDGLRAAVDHLDRLEAVEREAPSPSVIWETMRADRVVHRALIETTRSTRLLRAYVGIDMEIAYCFALCRVTSMSPDKQEHRRLLDALEAADEAAALDILIPHIDDARAQCLTAVRPPRLGGAGS